MREGGKTTPVSEGAALKAVDKTTADNVGGVVDSYPIKDVTGNVSSSTAVESLAQIGSDSGSHTQEEIQPASSNSSRGGRVSRAYGRIKYRYLLPFYRIFGPKPKTGSINSELRFAIDSRLPTFLRRGKANAFFVAGWCYHTTLKIRSLAFVANDRVLPIRDWKLGRPDVFRNHCPELDPLGHSYGSGFWGFVTLTDEIPADELGVFLRARLSDGSEVTERLCSIPIDPEIEERTYDAPSTQARGEGPLVAICMATYNPPIELFKRQIESIRNQTHRNWICVLSDDNSEQKSFDALREVLGDDRRFVVSRAEKRGGFYRNFERALELAPSNAQFVALCDQDDYWHPDKLEVLISSFDDKTTLSYADVNIVDRDRNVLANTYWTTRPNNYTDFSSLLLANTITGAASMFRQELVEFLLPFPERHGDAYHDHWIACCAMALGSVNYVDRPLHDYVQHSGNVIGHCAPKQRTFIKRARGIVGRLLSVKASLYWWRVVYTNELFRPKLIAVILMLRCGDRVPPPKMATLRKISRLDESFKSAVWLFLRSLRSMFGVTETLGAENYLFGALLWKRTYLIKSWLKRNFGGIPPQHARAADVQAGPSSEEAAKQPPRAAVSDLIDRSLAEIEFAKRKMSPLSLGQSATAPPRVNLLVPELNFKYFFGGYITKFNLARKLAERGLKVRIVIVDECDIDPELWRRQLTLFQGLENLLDIVEIEYVYERSKQLEVSHRDVFIATTWWTAHIARDAAARLGNERFIYLIQEYEPFTFAMGSLAALAEQTYGFSHYAIFSTRFLKDYFKSRSLGVFSRYGVGDEACVSFNNAITDVGAVELEGIADRRPKKLLVYARPEGHASRNMFEIAFLALQECALGGLFNDEWQLNGIGAVDTAGYMKLGQGFSLKLLERQPQHSYKEILLSHDVGLSLMYTPHPSLVPIEMASAGMSVVTNTFANKTAEKLIEISANLIPVEPTIDGIARGLRQAVRASSEYSRRVKGSRVNWPTNWDQSFDDGVMRRISAFVAAVQSAGNRRQAASE